MLYSDATSTYRQTNTFLGLSASALKMNLLLFAVHSAVCTHSTSNKCIIIWDGFRCSFAEIETSHPI